jgi:predicted transcriptional regulator
MAKSVLISIRPQWCELIAIGKKTIEVRKTRPKLETPFKCYIYCTVARHYVKVSEHMGFATDDLFRNPDTGKIKCGMSCELMCCQNEYDKNNFLNGKVIGKFVCEKIIESNGVYGDELFHTGLSYDDLQNYGCGKQLYGWHISALQIYDKPKELSEFYSISAEEECDGCPYHEMPVEMEPCKSCDGHRKYLYRAPQSWCYVEELQ